jgi:hypothetical protein
MDKDSVGLSFSAVFWGLLIVSLLILIFVLASRYG